MKKTRGLLLVLFACCGSFFQDLHNNSIIQFNFLNQAAVKQAVHLPTQDQWNIQLCPKNYEQMAQLLIKFRNQITHAKGYISRNKSQNDYNKQITKDINYLLTQFKSHESLFLGLADHCLTHMQERYHQCASSDALVEPLEQFHLTDSGMIG